MNTFPTISRRVKYNVLSLLIILVVGISWCMNIGWIRLIFALPMLIHAVLFYFSNNFFHRYSYEVSKGIKQINNAVYGSYLMCNVLLPDGGDTEDSIRVFFGLIKNEAVIEIASIGSELLFLLNIVLIIIQIIYTIKTKQKLKDNIRI